MLLREDVLKLSGVPNFNRVGFMKNPTKWFSSVGWKVPAEIEDKVYSALHEYAKQSKENLKVVADIMKRTGDISVKNGKLQLNEGTIASKAKKALVALLIASAVAVPTGVAVQRNKELNQVNQRMASTSRTMTSEQKAKIHNKDYVGISLDYGASLSLLSNNVDGYVALLYLPTYERGEENKTHADTIAKQDEKIIAQSASILNSGFADGESKLASLFLYKDFGYKKEYRTFIKNKAKYELEIEFGTTTAKKQLGQYSALKDVRVSHTSADYVGTREEALKQAKKGSSIFKRKTKE